MAKPRYEIRPLGPWTGPVTEDRQSAARFRAHWSATLQDLEHEVGLLGAQMVVIQIDVTEGELRRDGMLRANAKVGFPGVRISFDSVYGPLTYATDRYEARYYSDPPSWQANVRAIVLGLEALRAVDRYGITRTGEQYRGWTAIEASTGEFTMTRAQAADLLIDDLPDLTAVQVMTDPDAARRAYLRLAQKHHPDRGGDTELFRRLTAARDLLTRSS